MHKELAWQNCALVRQVILLEHTNDFIEFGQTAKVAVADDRVQTFHDRRCEALINICGVHVRRFPETAEASTRGAKLESLRVATAKNENVLDANREHDMRACVVLGTYKYLPTI